jgi:hypothetical protein
MVENLYCVWKTKKSRKPVLQATFEAFLVVFTNETKVEKSKRRGKLASPAKRGRRGELICGAFGRESKELLFAP